MLKDLCRFLKICADYVKFWQIQKDWGRFCKRVADYKRLNQIIEIKADY